MSYGFNDRRDQDRRLLQISIRLLSLRWLLISRRWQLLSIGCRRILLLHDLLLSTLRWLRSWKGWVTLRLLAYSTLRLLHLWFWWWYRLQMHHNLSLSSCSSYNCSMSISAILWGQGVALSSNDLHAEKTYKKHDKFKARTDDQLRHLFPSFDQVESYIEI